MGAIAEIVIAWLLRFRLVQVSKGAYEAALIKINASPVAQFVLLNLGGYAVIDWLVEIITSWKMEASETIEERKQAVFSTMEEWEAAGLDFVDYCGEYYARKLNAITGAVPGDTLYLETVLPDALVAWAREQIKAEIIKGGGALISGQTIQQLRAGLLPVNGWAGRGPAADVKWNDIQKQQADAALKFLTEKERKRRLGNRERQARYRRTHKRVTRWIKRH